MLRSVTSGRRKAEDAAAFAKGRASTEVAAPPGGCCEELPVRGPSCTFSIGRFASVDFTRVDRLIHPKLDFFFKKGAISHPAFASQIRKAQLSVFVFID